MTVRRMLVAIAVVSSLLTAGHVDALGVSHPVQVSDFRFTPAATTLQHGEGITWNTMGAPAATQPHTATDRTTLREFDVDLLPATMTGMQLNYAGTYPFLCTNHPRLMRGVLRVKMRLSPAGPVPVGESVSLSWATTMGPLPAGRFYDVQVLRPGAKRWRTFLNDTGTTGTTYTLNRRGTFRFRAIQHGEPGSGIRGRFSPVAKIAAIPA